MGPTSATNQSVEINMPVRDLFHKNHAAMSMQFKAWIDVHRVRSELNLDLDLEDACRILMGLIIFHINV